MPDTADAPAERTVVPDPGQFFSVSLEPLCIADERGRFVRVNPAFTRTLGWSQEELEGRPFLDFVHPDDREHTERTRTRALEAEVTSFQNRYRTRDGGWRWLSWRSTPGRDDRFVYAVARDVTDEKSAEDRRTRSRAELEERVAERTAELDQARREVVGATAAERRSESRYRAIFAHAPVGILLSTRDGDVLDANEALAQMLGYDSAEEVAALHIPTAVYEDPADRGILGRDLDNHGKVMGREVAWKRKDGTRLWVEIHAIEEYDEVAGAPHLLSFVHDVTRERSLRDQLRQAQKMEAVGTLAGGIAHDFNNLLTPIMSHAALAMDDLPTDEPIRDDLREIRDAAHRAAELTRQLLTFSRKQPFEPTLLDVNEVVRGMRRMLHRLIREDISFELHLAEEECPAETDRGRLEQVLVNLVVNARDAMPEGGRLSVATSRVKLADAYVHDHLAVKPGRYVLISVSDTGVGMEDKTRARIFEPFFTTKGVGEGTGLGLSTVYGIVRESGGHIGVYSEPGVGTVFRIYLPCPDSERRPITEPPAPETRRRVGGSGTVLVVEDDPTVRTVAAKILRRSGYRVLEAEDGADALAVLEKYGGSVDLLLSDVVMPGIDGPELAERMQLMGHGPAVLFVSGYTEHAIHGDGRRLGDGHFLEKPFTPSDLTRKVREILRQRAEDAGLTPGASGRDGDGRGTSS